MATFMRSHERMFSIERELVSAYQRTVWTVPENVVTLDAGTG